MFREATKTGQGRRTDIVDNINEVKTHKGTSKAYTLDRLHRESPKLYQAVVEKIEAQTLLGRFLKDAPKNQGVKSQLKGKTSGGTKVVPPEDKTPTLADIGISKKESAESASLLTKQQSSNRKLIPFCRMLRWQGASCNDCMMAMSTVDNGRICKRITDRRRQRF